MFNWLQLSDNELQALRLSLDVALRSTLFNLPLAITLAWILTRKRFVGRMLVDSIVHLPLVLPPVVIGYLLLLLFGVHGVIGSWLLRHFDLRLAFTRNGAALATAVMSLPLMVRSIRIALEGVDRGLEDVARTLGAGSVDRFCTITLPLILPGIVAGLITSYAAGLGEFGAVITFVGNVPGETQTLALALYAALQLPNGEQVATHLASISIVLGVVGLLFSEWLSRAVRRKLGQL